MINGLENLENRDDAQHTRDLKQVLSGLCEAPVATTLDNSLQTNTHGETEEEIQQGLQTTKMCFTTDGYVDCLAELVALGHLDKVEFSEAAEGHFVDGESVGLMPYETD